MTPHEVERRLVWAAAHTGVTDPRDPVVSDVFRRRRGLPPEPGWGEHLGLPLLVALVALRRPSLVECFGATTPADWVAKVDASGVLNEAAMLEIGGDFVGQLHGEHLSLDAKYGRSTFVKGEDRFLRTFDWMFANGLFEEGSGIVGTLVEQPQRAKQALRGAHYGRWRQAVAAAAALDVWVALRTGMVTGSVLLTSNLLSPAVVPQASQLESLGLRRLKDTFIEHSRSHFGPLCTSVSAVLCVDDAQGSILGPRYTDWLADGTRQIKRRAYALDRDGTARVTTSVER